jgi:hypothetical protein
MRKYTIEDFFGQWRSFKWNIKVSDNENAEISWSNGNSAKGRLFVFENFLIFQDSKVNCNFTVRVENISSNRIILTDLTNDIGIIDEMKKTFSDPEQIRKFNFYLNDSHSMDDIKQLFGLEKIGFRSFKNKDGDETNYYRHWNNDGRYAIVLKKDLAEKLKLKSDLPLFMEKSIKIGELGYYTYFYITEYIEPETENFYNNDDRSYEEFNGAYDYDDYTINSAFNGDPENYWNID